MNINEIRNEYPHIEQGVIYFNHASIGPLSNKVSEDVKAYVETRHSNISQSYDVFLKALTDVKSKLVKMFGGKSSQYAFTENVSMGLNTLAQGLKWKEGDEVILNDLEFPSNVYPFLNLQAKGVNVKFAKSNNGIVDVTHYEKLISSNTKLISISLVQFLTGYKANIKALGELCKKNDIIFVVDAIQGAGTLNINVEEYNIDFFVGGSHKWLMGLTGLGYFYISNKLNDLVANANLGWISVKDPWNLLDYNPIPRKTADRFQTGTMNSVGVIALNSSLDLFLTFGLSNIESKIKENTKYFINQLIEDGFNPILKNCPKENLAGITSVIIENAQEKLLQLKQKNIIAEMREGMLRFAPHFYNTKDEIDEVISELKLL